MSHNFPDQTRRQLKIMLPILFLLLVFLLFLEVGLPLIEKSKPIIPVTFDTIASHGGEKVSIQGLINPGIAVSSKSCDCSNGTCSDLELVPPDTEGSGWIFDDLEVYVELQSTYSAQPGHFYLPSSYNYEDLKIYTSAGQELSYNDAIRVIGDVRYIYEQGEKTILWICPYQIQAGELDCSKLVPLYDHDPIPGQWEFETVDRARIIHIMSNRWSNNLPEFKFFLPAGQPVSFENGGGSGWIEQSGCAGSAWTIYQDDNLREITLEEYQKYIEEKIIP